MRHSLRAALVIGLAAGCSSGQGGAGGATPAIATGSATQSQVADLARKLTTRAYGEFFVLPAHAQTTQRVWAEPGNRPVLEALVADPAQPLEARFLAAEVLFARDASFTARVSAAAIAELYAGALAHDLTGMANSWGLLYEHDDAGPVGIRFVMLGAPAVPALVRLLDDDRAPLVYDGSKEATVGNDYHYRIKDFAAYYLGQIRRVPVAFYREPAERDREIARLKQRLSNQRTASAPPPVRP